MISGPLVVTGTGTGVGKTVVTAALAALAAAAGRRVAVLKPAQTGVGAGEPGDVDEVRRLTGGGVICRELARYAEPLAPATAARRAGARSVTPVAVVAAARDLAAGHDLVLIEGAGGLLVRLDDAGGTLADVAVLLGCPVLVVAAAGLGTLNHTALTVEALAARGLSPAGVVIGAWPAEPDLAARCNLADLPAVTGVPLLGALPQGAGRLSAAEFLAIARRSLAADLGGNVARCGRLAGECRRPGRRRRREEQTLTVSVDQGNRQHDRGAAPDVLAVAREQVLERGEGLSEQQVLAVLELPDDRLQQLLALAHEVRMRWCGPEVEVEGIVSVKTGGCPEDCHFCSQSGQFSSPVRAVWLDIPGLVQAARETAATGATEFCIVAAVRGPDRRLLSQVRAGIEAIRAEPETAEINIACSLGMLTRDQVDELAAMGVHRYNHNLETARSHFPAVVTTHTWEERFETLRMVREAGMEVCCGGIIGLGETPAQRAEFAAQLAELRPDEVPMNFLNPRPGTPLEQQQVMDGTEALRTIAAFRLALPRTILRFAGGREITLGDLGARQGMLGGINAIIVGNYLTTLGRPAETDIRMLGELQMPIKALGQTL